jgi:hypothetical protein
MCYPLYMSTTHLSAAVHWTRAAAEAALGIGSVVHVREADGCHVFVLTSPVGDSTTSSGPDAWEAYGRSGDHVRRFRHSTIFHLEAACRPPAGS